MRILAVDDDPIILDLLQNALADHDGIELTCAESAEKATLLMEEQTDRFDCFLLDIMLPGVDGIELCEVLRNAPEYRTTPIIMITASREPDLMSRAFSMGATDFVSKPLDSVELRARINAAGMLNDSLLRERQAQHTLAELTEQTKVPIDEILMLETDGVTDLVTVENDLLRLPGGCYAMSLFSVDVLGLREVHKDVSPMAFRTQLEQVACAIVGAMWGRPSKVAYLGSGRYVGVLIHRARMDRETLAEAINGFLVARWFNAVTETDMPPALEVNLLSEQRLWSGRSAGDHLRKHLRGTDTLKSYGRHEEARLFARVEKEVA